MSGVCWVPAKADLAGWCGFVGEGQDCDVGGQVALGAGHCGEQGHAVAVAYHFDQCGQG